MSVPIPPPAEEERSGPPVKLLAACTLVGFGLAWLLFRERGDAPAPDETYEPDVEYLPPTEEGPHEHHELDLEPEDAEYEPA